MAKMKFAYLTALHLVWLGGACCFTNLEFYNMLKDHATDFVIDQILNATSCGRLTDSDIRIDETLCDDVINVPGGPNDEFDKDYLLQKVGFVPYESDDECDIIGQQDEGTVGETREHVEKYCHYRQYLIHGYLDAARSLQNLNDIHFHFHFHHHHDYHHCNHRDFVKCTCKRRKCSCCLRHRFRFNHCLFSTTFTLKACVDIEYRGKEACHKTTKSLSPKTTNALHTTTHVPPTTTPALHTTTQALHTTTHALHTTTHALHTTTHAPPTTTHAPPTTTHAPPTTTGLTPPPNEEYLNCERDIYDVTFTVNGRKIVDNHVTLDHLHPLCYNLRLGSGTANVCINFYSIDVSRKRVCTRLTGTWTIGHRETRLNMNVGCMVLSFSRYTDLMDILANEKFWREMVIDQELVEE